MIWDYTIPIPGGIIEIYQRMERLMRARYSAMLQMKFLTL
jgi:hypothetical protein